MRIKLIRKSILSSIAKIRLQKGNELKKWSEMEEILEIGRCFRRGIEPSCSLSSDYGGVDVIKKVEDYFLENNFSSTLRQALDEDKLSTTASLFAFGVRSQYSIDSSLVDDIIQKLCLNSRVVDICYVLENVSVNSSHLCQAAEPLLMGGHTRAFLRILTVFLSSRPKTTDVGEIIKSIMLARCRRLLCHTNPTSIESSDMINILRALETFFQCSSGENGVKYTKNPSYFLLRQLRELEKDNLNLPDVNAGTADSALLGLYPRLPLTGFPYLVEDRDFPETSGGFQSRRPIHDISASLHRLKARGPPLLVFHRELFPASFEYEMNEINKIPASNNLLNDLMGWLDTSGIGNKNKSGHGGNGSDMNFDANAIIDPTLDPLDQGDVMSRSVDDELDEYIKTLSHGDSHDEDYDDDDENDDDDDDLSDSDDDEDDDDDDDDDDSFHGNEDDIDGRDFEITGDKITLAAFDASNPLEDMVQDLIADYQSNSEEVTEGPFTDMAFLGGNPQSAYIKWGGTEEFPFPDVTSWLTKSHGPESSRSYHPDLFTMETDIFPNPRR